MSSASPPAATSRASDVPPLAVSHLSARHLPQWLGAGYFLLIALSIPALRLPGVTIRGNEFSWERCVFTAINAATLTGFQQGVPIDHYGPLGQAMVLMLTIAGTLLTLTIGGLCLNAALRLPYSPTKIVGATIYIYLMALG